MDSNTFNKINFCNSCCLKINDVNVITRIITTLNKIYGYNHSSRFPGPQPKSMEREFFTKFKNPYYVCEKSNGVRYILFCTNFDIQSDGNVKPCCFLINRKQDIYLLNFTFKKESFMNTILDGELIHSKNKLQYYFLIFDCINLNNNKLNELKFSERIKHAKQFCNSYKKKETDAFIIKCKEFIIYSPNTFEQYVNSINQGCLNYEIDGYIFTPENDHITSGTHENMLKFKNGIDNTVDFEVRFFNNNCSLYLGNRPVIKHYLEYKSNDSIIHEIKSNGSSKNIIVECIYLKELNGNTYWTPLLIRNDKQYPNSFYTFTKTLKNITENIQIEEFY